jgi:hypothetical protein
VKRQRSIVYWERIDILGTWHEKVAERRKAHKVPRLKLAGLKRSAAMLSSVYVGKIVPAEDQ